MEAQNGSEEAHGSGYYLLGTGKIARSFNDINTKCNEIELQPDENTFKMQRN
jgi:hypothetical protein